MLLLENADQMILCNVGVPLRHGDGTVSWKLLHNPDNRTLDGRIKVAAVERVALGT
jgi:hypothetical protein